MWAVCAIGLRVNGTGSEPVGIYWAVSRPPAKGDFVFALPPASPIFKLAKERGYLAAGPSPAGTCGLIKQVAALSGDRVTIGVQGVQVNGVLLKNSAPRPADEAGRPLRAYELSDYTLRSEEVLLMSDYNPASFERKLREAEIPGCEVEFDPDEAERIAFKEDALSDEDARESIIDL